MLAAAAGLALPGGLGTFEDAHIRIEADDFTLDGFDVAPGQKSKPLVMTFKKPDEVDWPPVPAL